MTTRLAEIADSPKNEYRLALSPGLSKRLRRVPTWLRSTTFARPSDGRSCATPPTVGHPDLGAGPAERAPRPGVAVSLMTFGCIANMDVAESYLDGGGTCRARPAVAGLRAALPRPDSLAASRRDSAGRWAAVHFGERIRNARKRLPRRLGGGPSGPRRRLPGALRGRRAGGVVNDHQLNEESSPATGCSCCPRRTSCRLLRRRRLRRSAPEAVRCSRTIRRGGGATRPRRAAAEAGFRRALGAGLETAPVRVTGGPAGRYGVAFAASGGSSSR